MKNNIKKVLSMCLNLVLSECLSLNVNKVLFCFLETFFFVFKYDEILNNVTNKLSTIEQD